MISQKVVREKPIPKAKLEILKEMTDNIKKYRTVLIASCKSLPGKQFHEIKKKLRGKAEIKSARKSSILRAIDAIDKGAIKNLKEQIGADVVVFYSDLDPFELSGMLTDNQSPTRAKAGDIAPYNIEIEPGPTELIPGPAISELGAVGLKIAVKDGKLEIQKGAVVVKEGEIIKENVASVLSKLDIAPMKVGFLPLAAYDSVDDKVYVGIRIDKEGTLDELRDLIGKALGFAVSVDYPTKETVSFFIAKAGAEEKALEKLVGVEESKEEIVEETKEKESSSEDVKDKESNSGTDDEGKSEEPADEKKEEEKDESVDNKNEKEDN
jgi:large subunit ribosomal protein L10